MSGATTIERPEGGRHLGMPIDPRIRARRIEVQRDAGRRRLQRLLEAGLLALVAAGFAGALQTPLLDVDRIVVRETGRTGTAAIEEAVDVAIGTPLIDVDVHAAAARVADLPWVDEATVARRVDGTLEVSVTERVPIAQVRTAEGAVLLVDGEGRALGPPGEAPQGAASMVLVTGAASSLEPGETIAARLRPALAVAVALAERVPGAVAELEVRPGEGSAADEITGRLAQGGIVRFGAASELDAKLLSLVTVLEQVDTAGLAVLDLRLPGNPVLTREEA